MVRFGILLFAVFLASHAIAQDELAHPVEVYALASATAREAGSGPNGGFRLGVHRTAVTDASGQSTTWRSLWSAGAGTDILPKGGLVFRAVEFDLMLLGASPSPVLKARISSGFVYRFGRQ